MNRPALLAILIAASGSSAQVIFDTRNPGPGGIAGYYFLVDFDPAELNSWDEQPGGWENAIRAGQAISFAPGHRFVTEFQAIFTFGPGLALPVFATTLTLYENIAGFPGQELWSGRVAGAVGVPGSYQDAVVSFHPNITVPDSVVFALTMEDVAAAGRMFGPGYTRITQPIGAVAGPVLLQDTDTLQWAIDPVGQVGEHQFEARVIAGPAPACYANCDSSTATPILNVADFTCFLQRFAAGEPYANCDQSTQTPTLNVADFTCFLQQFAAGCP